MDLLRQAGENLAGRIEFVSLNPLDVLDAAPDDEAVTSLWVRGGFPDSFLVEVIGLREVARIMAEPRLLRSAVGFGQGGGGWQMSLSSSFFRFFARSIPTHMKRVVSRNSLHSTSRLSCAWKPAL